MKRVAMLAVVAWAGGCISLDGFFYSPRALTAYTLPETPDNPTHASDPACPVPPTVPAELIDRLTLTDANGHPVAAVFARQPVTDAMGRANFTYATAPTILYDHGNADNIDNYWGRVSLLWSLGANVLIYDYPGYGLTPGSPDEAGVYAAARAGLGYIRHDLAAQIDESRVFIYGWSLGGASATEMAFEQPSTGLILESTFTSVAALVADASLVVPRSFVMTNQFDTIDKIRQAGHNARFGVLIFHGDADDFVNTRYGYDLYDQLDTDPHPVPHVLQIVGGAQHSNVPCVAEVLHDHVYTSRVTAFLAQH